MPRLTKLDKLDRKLLVSIDFHARDSYAKLAKRIGTSKQSVDYKLRRLEKAGIIKGYIALINTPALGYFYCRLLITLQGATAAVVKEITTYCERDSRVFWLFEMQGSFDLIIDFWAGSINEFRIFTEALMQNFGGYIKRRSENIVTDAIHFQNRYITDQKKSESFHLREAKTPIKIDDIDRKLLRLLSEKARLPLVDLAKALRISAAAIAARVKKLERKSVIAGYRPNLDHNKLGYGYYKIFLNLSFPSTDNLNAVKEYLSQQPCVLYVVEGIGLPADMDFELVSESPLQLDEFIRKLRATFPGIIADYNALLFTGILKVRYLPF